MGSIRLWDKGCRQSKVWPIGEAKPGSSRRGLPPAAVQATSSTFTFLVSLAPPVVHVWSLRDWAKNLLPVPRASEQQGRAALLDPCFFISVFSPTRLHPSRDDSFIREMLAWALTFYVPSFYLELNLAACPNGSSAPPSTVSLLPRLLCELPVLSSGSLILASLQFLLFPGGLEIGSMGWGFGMAEASLLLVEPDRKSVV